MKLPENISGIKEALKRNGTSLKSLLISRNIDSISHPESKHIMQYSTPGLFSGRPLNQTMIVLYGKTGAGKSTTINRLFDDETLCRVSGSTSETSEVIECFKDLTVMRSSVNPPISAKLSIVDVPGALDTDRQKELTNAEKISNFRNFHKALQERSIPSKLALFQLSSKVYPNSVLFAFNANDNRQVGPDSDLAKSLKLLKSYKFVDCKCPNLIMVGTFACSLGIKKSKYEEHVSTVTERIQKIVHKLFGIENVPVVFVENEPEDYDLRKDGDFYLLPDGSQSHANLIKAMLSQYEKSIDKLSLLLTSWYFRTNCPDKQTPPKTETVNILEEQNNLQMENTNIVGLFKELNIGGDFDEITPDLNFHALGTAYCPMTECLKSHYLFASTTEKNLLQVEKSKFLIPKYVQPYVQNKAIFKSISCHSKDEYERSKAEQYSFDAGVKLIVSVSSTGRWTTQTTTTNQDTIISILFEQQVCSLHIDNPEQYVSPDFLEVLNGLPSTYTENTADEFRQFFAKYGTHLVSKQSLGGWIKFDCHIGQTSFNQQSKGQIEAKAQGIFKKIISGGGGYSNETAFNELQQVGMTDEQISIGGGDPPLVSSLKEITPQVLTEWLSSVKQKPSELEHTRVLYPFYNLKLSKNKDALWNATTEYLKNELKQKIANTRNEISEKAESAATSASGGSSCVPAWATVITKLGPKRVDKLENFDKVLTIGKNGEHKWTPFYGYAHREVDTVAEFLILELDNGKTLTITRDHLMFTIGQGGERIGKMAQNVTQGDYVISVDFDTRRVEKAQVIAKTVTTSTGIYSPLTMEGTLLVESVLISSYADIENFAVAHNAFLPLRLWAKAARRFNKPENVIEEGIHPYAKVLMKLRSLAPGFF